MYSGNRDNSTVVACLATGVVVILCVYIVEWSDEALVVMEERAICCGDNCNVMGKDAPRAVAVAVPVEAAVSAGRDACTICDCETEAGRTWLCIKKLL